MKRFVVFAILGPCLAGATLLLLVLPLATLLGGTLIEMSLPPGQTLTLYLAGIFPALLPIIYLAGIFPALLVGVFDWIAELVELPRRPIGTAIVGWGMSALVLRGWLALPDLPGWFILIGLIGAIPAFVCSWLTSRIRQKQSVTT